MPGSFLLRLGIIAVIGQSLVNAISFFLPLYLSLALHFSVLQVGVVLSMLGAGTLFGSLISYPICKFCSEYVAQIISFFGMAICLYLIGSTTHLFLLNIVVFLLGGSLFLFRTANQVWMLNLVAADRRVHLTNLRRMILNAGIGVGFILNGFLSHHNFKLMFYLAAIVALFLVGLLIFLWVEFPAACRDHMKDERIYTQKPQRDGTALPFGISSKVPSVDI